MSNKVKRNIKMICILIIVLLSFLIYKKSSKEDPQNINDKEHIELVSSEIMASDNISPLILKYEKKALENIEDSNVELRIDNEIKEEPNVLDINIGVGYLPEDAREHLYQLLSTSYMFYLEDLTMLRNSINNYSFAGVNIDVRLDDIFNKINEGFIVKSTFIDINGSLIIFEGSDCHTQEKFYSKKDGSKITQNGFFCKTEQKSSRFSIRKVEKEGLVNFFAFGMIFDDELNKTYPDNKEMGERKTFTTFNIFENQTGYLYTKD